MKNFKDIPDIRKLSDEELSDIEVVARVFPFKTNNYVIEKLINWDNIPYDPMFILNFPQKGILLTNDYDTMALAVLQKDEQRITETARKIQYSLNPHPAGQLEYNTPTFNGKKLKGIQHKYMETVLFMAKKGQTCHAFCTFCFRWPQFIGDCNLRIGTNDIRTLIEYLKEHPGVTDLLLTGGDPLVMKTETIEGYILPLLNADLPNLKNIRIGTKVLSYWPYRFLNDEDSPQLLKLFKRIVDSGKHLAFMAHFNHPQELSTDEVQEAIARIRDTGAEIRTQSPILRNINNNPKLWAAMWKKQVELGCIPYYMFVVRDTGAQHYFGLPLIEAFDIFRNAFNGVSGLARTVRGPVMSTTAGKIQMTGFSEVLGHPVITLAMIQARNPDWVLKPFYAKYDEDAFWIDDLMPAFGEDNFFFEHPYNRIQYLSEEYTN
ncbi:L-lysine 2,3-aminomutase [bacterium BMS3Abin08]|nr:L-lysine 2,3-aminomutase [bacterium BMS3Abin08]